MNAGRQYPRQLLVCSGQRQGRPDISLLDSTLQKQWDQDGNAYLGNITLTPGSKRKVSWLCDQCPDGHLHQWMAAIYNRSRGSGCPQCSGRKVCQHNSLATKAPRAAADWDYEANVELGTPETLVANHRKRVWWHCQECGHRWTTSPNKRLSRQRGCPQCALQNRTYVNRPTFAQSQHKLLAEWDHARNEPNNNFPSNTRLKSNKQIYWLCSQCPAGHAHSWSTMPCNRTRSKAQSGCPYCAGYAACRCNSLETLYPAIASEWDHAKNADQPGDHTASSNDIAWWCNLNGDRWQQSIYDRTRNVRQQIVSQKYILSRTPSTEKQ